MESEHTILDLIDTCNYYTDAVKYIDYYHYGCVIDNVSQPIDNLAESLRNSAVNYNGYVQIHAGNKLMLEYRNLRDRVTGQELMQSPFLWKLFNNSDNYERFIEQYRDNTSNLEFKVKLNKPVYDPKMYRKLDKQLSVFRIVLEEYGNIRNCDEIKSIYNIGKYFFHVDINNDSHDELIAYYHMDKFDAIWIHNGIRPTNHISNSMTLEKLLENVATVLVNEGVQDYTEMKRLDIGENGGFKFFLNDGRIFEVTVDDDLCVHELTHFFDNSNFLNDDSILQDGDSVFDDDDDSMIAYDEDDYFSCEDSDDDDPIVYNDDMQYHGINHCNDELYDTDSFDQLGDNQVDTIFLYIERCLDLCGCKDILEVKYIGYYPRNNTFKIVFTDGNEIRSFRRNGKLDVYLSRKYDGDRHCNYPHFRQPKRALARIQQILSKYFINNMMCLYQIDINNCEYVIHLTNDTKIVSKKNFYMNTSSFEMEDSTEENELINDTKQIYPNDEIINTIEMIMDNIQVEKSTSVSCIDFFGNSWKVTLINGDEITYNGVIDHYSKHARLVDNHEKSFDNDILVTLRQIIDALNAQKIHEIDDVKHIDINGGKYKILLKNGGVLYSQRVYGICTQLEDEKGAYLRVLEIDEN